VQLHELPKTVWLGLLDQCRRAQRVIAVHGWQASYEDKGESGQPVYRHFCARCGSPIYSAVAAMTQLDFLKAGTMDDTSSVKPVINVWCKSAQSWVQHPEGVPSFAENPPME
jgi:hypothetical protein